jgi:LuxR family transcriptional regulator, quorum-sensing system regulator CciR
MGSFRDVQNFVDEANRITEVGELDRLLHGAANSFGFDYFALVHHAELKRTTPEIIRRYNYPVAWTGTIIERGYFSDDPMHAACQRTAVGFLWSDVSRLIKLTGRQKEILEAAGTAGMGEGFTVPANVPGESNGSCSFGVKYGRKVSAKNLPAAQYIGCFAFEAARRIAQLSVAKGETDETRSLGLSQRQLECMVLAARGKSDVDIATLLGLSVDTVHTHMENAKRRFNCSTRMTAVVRALYSGQLVFADILR